MGVSIEKLKELKGKMPYKWREQSVNARGATMVAYIDARQLFDKLDEVCGEGNWQTDFKTINNNLFGGIGILINKDNGEEEWVWKWDTGAESNVQKEKGEVSDCAKRAGVQWGCGRFLYSLGIVTLKSADYKGKFKPADDNGNIIWDKEVLTDLCMKAIEDGVLDRTRITPTKSTPKPQPAKQTTPPTSTGKPLSGMQPNTAFDSTKEPTSDVTERKAKATKAFETLDKAKVLGYIIKDLKKKYTSIATFIEKESIDVVLSTYEAVKQFKKEEK